MIARSGAGSTDERPADAGAPVACTHCGLPVPDHLVVDGDEEQFCCHGCRAVRAALRAGGLDTAFDRVASRDVRSARRPSTISGRSFAHLDGRTFQQDHVQSLDESRCRADLAVDGLHCAACTWLLERMPPQVDGLLELRARLDGTATIDWDPSRVGLASIAARLDRLGYQLRPLEPRAAREERRRAFLGQLVRLAAAGAIAGNVMAIAFALYGDDGAMDAGIRGFLQWISLGLAVLSLAWPGRVFLANAWTALRTRTPHMDLPVAIGLLAAVGGGFVATVEGDRNVYFESATMLVFLLLAGRLVLEARLRAARRRTDLLATIAAPTARRVRTADGQAVREEVPADELSVGDLIEIPAGEPAPADGRLVESTAADGAARVDASMLTGESRPVRVEAGGDVHAGTRVLGSPATLEVVAVGGATRIASILRLAERSRGDRPRLVARADRVAAWFVPIVTGIALVTFIALRVTMPEVALSRTIALLVVACPCALGLATPLSLAAASAKAARRGILLAGGDAIERLASVRGVIFDKTGTLTTGRPAVVGSEGDDAAWRLASRLESASSHPVASAVREAWDAGDDDLGAIREIPGLGIEGEVGGRRVRVERGDEDDRSRIDLSIDGRRVGAAWIEDRLRPESPEVVRSLRTRGLTVGMLSGDAPGIVDRTARRLGIEPNRAVGRATPESKTAAIASARRDGPVAMIGDGVNDAAALAASDAGIAIGGGAQAALQHADACLARGGLEALPALFDGAASTVRAINIGLAASVGYNVFAAVGAILGVIGPIEAAILMPLSGLTVVAIAVGLPRFDDRRSDQATPPLRPTPAASTPTAELDAVAG